jgi:tetratricopeptide (TPR) repeat protein
LLLLLGAAASDLIETGLDHLKNGELDQSREKLLLALEQNPDNERALYYLSLIAQRRGKDKKAFEYFNRLARRSPDEFKHFIPREVYQFTGILAHQIGEHRRAMELLEKAQKVAESESVYQQLEGWRQRARSAYLRQLGRKKEERLQNILKTSEEYLKQNEPRKGLELLLEHREEFKGEVEFDSQIKKLRLRVQFHNWLQESEQVSGETSASELENLIERGTGLLKHEKLKPQVKPDLARLYYYRGQLYFKNNKFSRARKMFFQALSLESEPEPQTLQALGRSNYQLGDYQEAKENIEKIRELHPEFNLDRRLRRAIWWQTEGYTWLYVGILVVVVLSLASFFLYNWNLFNRLGVGLGKLFYFLGWEQSALSVFQHLCEVEEVDEKSFKIWFELLSRRAKKKQVLELLRAREEINELPTRLRLEYAYLLRECEEIVEATQIFEECLSEWEKLDKKQRIKLTGNLSKIYLRQNNEPRAFDVLEMLLAEKPSDSQLNRRLLKLAASLDYWEKYMQLGRRWFDAVSRRYIQKTHRRGYTTSEEKEELNDPPSIADFLLSVYSEQAEVSLSEQPVKMLEFLLELSTELPGKNDLSRRLLEELLRRDLPDRTIADYLSRLAVLYEKNNDYQKAIDVYKRLRQLKSSNLAVLEKLGKVYLQAEKRAEAQRVFEEVFEIQRDNATAASGLKELGRRYETEENFEKAARAYRLIINNSHFQKTQIQYRLGVCLFRQDKYEEALSVFQKIKQGDELLKARIVLYMSRCLLGMGHYDVALERISEVDPKNNAFPSRLRREIHYWRGRAQEAASRAESALEHYRKILASDVEFRDVSERIDRLREKE